VLLSLYPGPTQHFALYHATIPKRRSRRGPGAQLCYSPIMSFSGPLVKIQVVYTLSPLSETEGVEFFTVRSTHDQNTYYKLVDLIRRLLPTNYHIFFINDHRPVPLQTLFPCNVSKYTKVYPKIPGQCS